MNTKKALGIFSKGEASPDSPLAEHRERFMQAYEQREATITARQTTDVVQLPFLESLRRKIAKMVDSPDNSLPVVGRYDLYLGVRKLAERTSNDNGLSRLVPHLEKLWHADPLGTLNYGEVRGLVASIRDRYPRSKAADAIEAECTRVGLHKLPVAKLARIAGTIQSQADYDAAMETSGLSGDRPEQIRARALVRGLVELRGASIDAHEPKARDERNVEQRVADRVQAEWEKPWLKKEKDGEEHEADDEASEKEAQMDDDGPPKPEKKEKGPPKPPKKGPPMDGPGDDMDAPMDGPDLDMGGPDDMVDTPAESGPEQAQDIMQEIDEAAQEIINDAPEEAQEFIQHEEMEGHHNAPPGTAEWGAEEILLEDHSAAPPSPEWLQEEMQEMAGGDMPGDDMGMDMGGPMGSPMGGPPMGGPPMGMPPPGPGMMEGQAPPAIPPVSMGDLKPKPAPAPMLPQLPPEKQEAPGHFNRMRGERVAAEEEKKSKGKGRGNGIPLPKGEIKAQPEVQTYAPKMSPSSGGKVLKASDVEARLLAGQKVKIGSVSIHVNKTDEVEIWNRNAGRACGLVHLDAAIADFMEMCRDQRRALDAQKLNATFHVAEMVHVPCEQCSEMNLFEKSANAEDEYGCTCGHLISAGLVDELAKLAQWSKEYKLQVRYPVTKDVNVDARAHNRVLQAIKGLNIEVNNRGLIVASIQADDVATMTKHLEKMGARVGQAAPGLPPGPNPNGMAPMGGGAPPPNDPGKPISEIIQDALQHYHNRNLAFMPAVAEMKKEYKERAQEFESPEASGMILQIGNSLWGPSQMGGAGAPGAPGAMGGVPPPQPGATTMMAALKLADSKMKAPAIRKPKDHVSVPSDLGKDSETSGSIPTPGGAIKTQPNKEQHQKLSPKELGSDSETKDLMPDPGKPKAEHDPKSQSGVKLPEKGLDKDTEPNDPFKTPSLGAEPKVKKS